MGFRHPSYEKVRLVVFVYAVVILSLCVKAIFKQVFSPASQRWSKKTAGL